MSCEQREREREQDRRSNNLGSKTTNLGQKLSQQKWKSKSKSAMLVVDLSKATRYLNLKVHWVRFCDAIYIPPDFGRLV